MNRIPIVALCGFLGSGKTTLLRRWRREDSLRDAALIVHDLSTFGLDVELLSDEGGTPSMGRLGGRVAALHGEHAGERLHESVGEALDQIAALDPAAPLVLCESTGAARPWPLIRALTQDDRFFLRHVIVTVDALNLHRDFEDGRVFVGQAPMPDDPALRQAAEVLAEQILFASVILLTKVDTVPQRVVEAQTLVLQTLRRDAVHAHSAHAGLSLSQLDIAPAPPLAELKGKAEQFGLTEQSATAAGVESRFLRDPRPFHPQRLHDVCQRHLSTGVYRTKGFVWLASRPGDVLLWQQSGSQVALEITGVWRAEIAQNPESRLLPEEVEHLRERLRDMHPVFGDRHNELTLIGLPGALASFASALEGALCTEAEVAAWQNGETFPDPWPTSVRTIE
ncbi:MAG: GTP-binding protein [Bacteroidota bacterium]